MQRGLLEGGAAVAVLLCLAAGGLAQRGRFQRFQQPDDPDESVAAPCEAGFHFIRVESGDKTGVGI